MAKSCTKSIIIYNTLCALRLFCIKLFIYDKYNILDFNILIQVILQHALICCQCLYYVYICFISFQQLQLRFESSTALGKMQPGFGFNVIRGNYARKSCSPFARRNGCT